MINYNYSKVKFAKCIRANGSYGDHLLLVKYMKLIHMMH